MIGQLKEKEKNTLHGPSYTSSFQRSTRASPSSSGFNSKIFKGCLVCSPLTALGPIYLIYHSWVPLYTTLLVQVSHLIKNMNRQGQRSGATGVHHNRQHSEHYLDASSKWFNSSSNHIPPLQVFHCSCFRFFVLFTLTFNNFTPNLIFLMMND